LLWVVGYFSPSILIILGGAGAGTFYWSAVRSSDAYLEFPAILGEIFAAVLAHIVAGVHCTYGSMYAPALPTIAIILVICALVIPGEGRRGGDAETPRNLSPDASVRDMFIFAIVLAPIFRFPLYTSTVSPALVLAVSRWGALVGRLFAIPMSTELPPKGSATFWGIAVLATLIGWFVCPHKQADTLALSFFLGLSCGGASSESSVPSPWQFIGRAFAQTLATAVGELAGGYAPQIVAIVLISLVVAWDLFDLLVYQKNKQ
jgi:hypothetical protein